MRVLRTVMRLSVMALLIATSCDDDSTGPAAPQSSESIILQVDFHDFVDDQPTTNSLIFRGIQGAIPDVTVTDNGNFPELELQGFFTTDITGSGETSASTERLSDLFGRTYGRLFRSGHFSSLATTDISPTSIGLLATNRQHHDFDVHQTALFGTSIFDVSALGFTSDMFGTGGDVYAQDFPFVKIGRWEVAPAPTVILQVDLSAFHDGDPATNSVAFTGVNGALPRTVVTDNGNFPELELVGFFTADQTRFGETTASTSALADHLGRTYGQLFLHGHFTTTGVEIAPTSLGLLATNRQHHDYDVDSTALIGRSVFDLISLGLTTADFGTGGDVLAQDFPWVTIGRWVAVGIPAGKMLGARPATPSP